MNKKKKTKSAQHLESPDLQLSPYIKSDNHLIARNVKRNYQVFFIDTLKLVL